MVGVRFVEHKESERSIEAAEGISLMQAAKNVGVPGIDADCDGACACACATCHAYVDATWLDAVVPVGIEEAELL